MALRADATVVHAHWRPPPAVQVAGLLVIATFSCQTFCCQLSSAPTTWGGRLRAKAASAATEPTAVSAPGAPLLRQVALQ